MSSFTKWATWTPDAEPEDAPASSTAPAAGASAGASSSSAPSSSSKALDARARVAALKARAAAAASAGAAPTASPPTDVFVRAAVATNQAPAAGAYAARLASDAEALQAEVGERDAARAAVRRLAAAVDDVLRGATATATAEGEPGASNGEASWARALASAEEEATRLAGGVERAAPKPLTSAHDDHHHHHHHTHTHGHHAHNAQPCCEVAAVATAHAPTPASTAPPSWREEVAGDAAVLLRRCAYARAALLLARGRPELCVDACRSLLLRAPQASPFPWLLRGRAYASFGCPAGLLLAQLHVDRCLALAGLRADRVSDDFLHADVGVGDGEGEGEGKTHPSPGSAGASPTPSDPLLLPLDAEYGLRGGPSSAPLALGSAAAAEGDDTPSSLSSPSPSPSTTSLATLARLAGALAAPNTLRDDWTCFVSGPLSKSPKASASAPASLTHLRGVKRGVMAALFAASMCSAAEIEGDELRRAAAGDAQPPSAGARSLVTSSSAVVALSLAAQAALLLGEGMPGSARTRFAAALRRGGATPTADDGSVASCLDAAAAALPLDSSGTPSPSSSAPTLLLVTLLVASGGLTRSLLSLGRNSDDLALAGRSAGLALACLAALESRGLRLPALRAFLHLARGEVRRDSGSGGGDWEGAGDAGGREGGGDWEGAGSDFAAADAALREMGGGAKDGVGCAGALVRACAEEEKGDEAAPRRLAALALDGVWPGSVGEGVRGGGGGGSEPDLTATWLPTAAGIALARRKLAARRREAQEAAGKGKG
jgi:hypothetical protein